MKLDIAGLCSMLVVLLAAVIVYYAFMDLLKKRQSDETEATSVLERQMRGLGLLSLSGLVLGLGAFLCVGMAGGFKGLGKVLGQLKI